MTQARPGLLEVVQQRIQAAIDEDPFVRDPAYIQGQLPKFERLLNYFRPHFSGFEHLPKSGPYLIVGNHSGGMYTPDAYALLAAFWRNQGTERELYAMGHNILFASPIADWYRKIGIIPADPRNAGRVLDRNAALLIYPGGDHESYRPFWERNKIDFAGRKGFIRLAIQRQVPIVPVVCHGGHHSILVLSRGDKMAEKIGMGTVRVKIFPWQLAFPWGLVPGFFPFIPLPADVNTTFCPAMTWPELGPEAANDKVLMARCYDEVVGTMQKTLDHMVATLPSPLGRIKQRTREVLERAPWHFEEKGLGG